MMMLSCDHTANIRTLIQSEPITIASWNMKNFGLSKLSDSTRLIPIVEILQKYDLIALQEIKDKSFILIDSLLVHMDAGGKDYSAISSLRLGRGTVEQYVFIYDVAKIIPDMYSIGYGHEPNNVFARPPFYLKFTAGNFDFYLMTIHTDPDEVDTEIPALVHAYNKLQDETPDEDDIIVLGDFNGKSPGTLAGSYCTMTEFSNMPGIVFAINEETNTKGGRAYDNIIYNENYTSEATQADGVDVFWESYGLTVDEAFRISDHKPVWATFRTDIKDDD